MTRLNLRNGVLAQLHEALDGKLRVMDDPLTSGDELAAVAADLKAEYAPKYDAVKVEKVGPNRVTFQLEPADA